MQNDKQIQDNKNNYLKFIFKKKTLKILKLLLVIFGIKLADFLKLTK